MLVMMITSTMFTRETPMTMNRMTVSICADGSDDEDEDGDDDDDDRVAGGDGSGDDDVTTEDCYDNEQLCYRI